MCRRVSWRWLAIVLVWSSWAAGGLAGPALAEPAKPAKNQAVEDKEDDYELQKILVDAIDQVQRNYVREVSRRKLIEAAIKGMLTELDPYSAYISPQEMDRFRTAVESEFGGIGIQVAIDGGRLKVLSPLVGTPAYRAGLMAGDAIVEIDGKSTAHTTIEEAVQRLKGKSGTKVTLSVVHPGSDAREKVTITREIIHIDTVLGDRRKGDDRWDFMLDPKKGIGYIRVVAFGRETARELRRALEDLKQQKLRGLILDLRFNPGGLLSSAIEVSNLFISHGRIVSTAGRNSPERIWDAHKDGAFERFPMAILVNHFSASASEIVSACLQDNHRAVVVGERTWGKGSVQNVIPLDDRAAAGEARTAGDSASALKLTIAGYRRPSGKNIDRTPGAKEGDAWGVSPDPGFEVKVNEEERASLMADRWRRDLVPPKKLASAPKSGPARPEPTKSVPTKSGPVKSDPSKPGPVKSDPAKSEPARPVPPPKQAGPSGPTQPPGEAKTAPPVDRQLQKAIEYLTTELARAK